MSVAATTAQPVERSLSLAGLVVLAIGSLDLGLEQSLIFPALPALAVHYDASLIAASWIATGYLLAAVVAIPLLGRLGDVFGRRRLLLVALGAFTVGGLLCALSDSISLVIAGRIVQGAGSAAGALTLGLLRDAVPPERLTRSIGIVIGGVSAGGAIGSVLSGILVDNTSPQSIFWFLSALSFTLMVGALAFVPESPERKRVPIDAVGAVLLGSGLAALLLAISKGNSWHWDSGWVLGLFAASALLLAAFVLAESRVRQPLVDLALVATRPFSNANVCVFAAGYSFFVVLIVVPQLAAMPEPSGYGFGYSTTRTGLLLVPMAIVAMAASWIAGRSVDRVGPRALMAVGSAAGIGGYVLATLAHDDAAALALFTGLIGVTFGFTLTGISAVVIRGATIDKTSIAAGVNGVVRTTASAIAAAAAAAIITGAGLTGPFPAESGFTRTFVMGAIACGVGLVASVLLPGRAGVRHFRS
jgi:EmrB/QacA subfamily drug resistance transporter